jgi:hypothetical protein
MTDMPLGRNRIDCDVAAIIATVDELTYRSYRANRLRSPEVLPERWALLPCFAVSITELEERFQKEKVEA